MSRFKLTKKDQEWSKEMVSLTCREALNSAYVQLLDNHPATEHVSREAVERIRDFSQSKHCFTLPNDSGGGGGGGGGGGMTSSFSFSSSAAVSCYSSSSSSASALVQLSMEPLLFHTSATLKLKFLLSSFQKCLILGVRTLFSDQLTAETAFINSSELLNVVLNVVAAELSFATSEEFNHSAAPESESESGAASTRKKGFCQLVGNPPPPPAFLTGQTVGELYQETVLFVCSRNKAGSDAVENAEEAEEMLQLSKEYARHTLVLLVSLGLAANQMSAAAIYKLLLELVAEIVLAKKLNFDRESEERARRNIATSESDDSSSSSSLSSEEEEEDNNDDSSLTSTDEETSRHHLAAARKETKKMV